MFRMKNKTIDGKDPHKMVGNLPTYVILALAIGAMTFFGMCTPQGQFNGLGGVAGKVGGEEITNAEFSRAYESYSQRARQQYGDNFDAAQLRVARTVLDQLISQEILYQEAEKLGLGTSEDEIIDQLKEAAAFKDEDGKFSPEQFSNYLRYNRYSEASFMEEMQKSVTVQKLRQFIISSNYSSSKSAQIEFKLQESKMTVSYLKFDPQKMNVAITSEERAEFAKDESSADKIKAYYEANKSDYLVEEQVDAQHILISYSGARNATGEATKRSKENARKKAEALLVKLSKDSSQFTSLAKKETDDQSGKKNGGELGFFKREDMVEPFSQAAFSMKPGELSGLVETEFGFHIIKVKDLKPKKETTLAQATDSIVTKLITREKGPAYVEKRAKAALELAKGGQELTADFKKEGVVWEKTTPFAANSRYISGLGSSPEIKEAVLSLNKVGAVYEQVIPVGRNFFVIKLDDVKKAEMDKLDEQRRNQISTSARFSEGYSLFDQFEKAAIKEYEENGRIYRNPSYLALDNQQTGSNT